jgi:hypothetical protein
MSLIPAGFAEATLEVTIPGDAGPAFVVTGHDFGPAVNAQIIADALAAVYGTATNLRSIMGVDATLSKVTVRANFAGPDLFVGEAVINAAGLEVRQLLPPQNAVLFQKLSGLAGRRNRGRMYVPAIPEDLVDMAGMLDSGYLSNCQAAATSLLAEYSAAALPLVILHDDAAFAPTDVSALEVSPKVATQRRRLR